MKYYHIHSPDQAPSVYCLFLNLTKDIQGCQSQSDEQVKVATVEWVTLWKQAYSNIMKILRPQKENFEIKNSDIPAQNIDFWYSVEPPR